MAWRGPVLKLVVFGNPAQGLPNSVWTVALM